MNSCEKVFNISELRLIILSYYMDKHPYKKEKPVCCGESFYNKIDNLKYRFFRCILARFGIVTPVIFR